MKTKVNFKLLFVLSCFLVSLFFLMSHHHGKSITSNNIEMGLAKDHALTKRNKLSVSLINKVATSKDENIMEKKTITLGVISLSFYKVVGSYVNEYLKKEGYETIVIYGSHAEIFPKIASGEVDLLVAAWLPNAHKSYWDKYQDELIKITTLYEDARLYWAVPAYVPESSVASVEDLLKKDVQSKMRKDIINVGPGSGLEIGSLQILKTYGLDKAGYTISTQSAEKWANVLNEAEEKQEWVVVPLWTPQYLNIQYKMRPLEHPKKILGEKDNAYLIATKNFEKEIDTELLNSLKQIELSLNEVAQMDFELNIDGLTLEEIALKRIDD